jgi:hypothetical protein
MKIKILAAATALLAIHSHAWADQASGLKPSSLTEVQCKAEGKTVLSKKLTHFVGQSGFKQEIEVSVDVNLNGWGPLQGLQGTTQFIATTANPQESGITTANGELFKDAMFADDASGASYPGHLVDVKLKTKNPMVPFVLLKAVVPDTGTNNQMVNVSIYGIYKDGSLLAFGTGILNCQKTVKSLWSKN